MTTIEVGHFFFHDDQICLLVYGDGCDSNLQENNWNLQFHGVCSSLYLPQDNNLILQAHYSNSNLKIGKNRFA